MKTTSTFFAATLVLLSGCITPVDEPAECVGPELLVKSLESEYSCQNTTRQLNINLSETYTVIRSQEEFDKQVTGSCRPQIDFTTYDLVIGKKGLPNGVSGIAYTLRRECNSNKEVLNVAISLGMTTEAPNITYHALIPKLAAGQEIGVQVEVK
ncbi:hypothetical protein K3G63_08760 [Hymenobacter sp. HSC-4F20]|uniref:hypothetical protein n=1 Tax=Hymenobacter sp. HSC-4F20 TaxID=2864135 RepID=UPI001C72B16F|nr:hypothetical protein [Hymenobacter sp. HSC-4F20]MBX0290526.1 hypothetical protein [Hymenobacter sp. HSC-4F20]